MRDQLNLVYFGDFEGDVFNLFMEAAKSNQVYTCYHAPGSCAHAFDTQPNTINIYKKFNEPKLVYNNELSFDSLIAWLADSSIPSVINFSDDYAELIVETKQVSVVLFTNEESSDLITRFTDIAKALRGEALFVISGTNEGVQEQFALAMGMGMEERLTPAIRLIYPT